MLKNINNQGSFKIFLDTEFHLIVVLFCLLINFSRLFQNTQNLCFSDTHYIIDYNNDSKICFQKKNSFFCFWKNRKHTMILCKQNIFNTHSLPWLDCTTATFFSKCKSCTRKRKTTEKFFRSLIDGKNKRVSFCRFWTNFEFKKYYDSSVKRTLHMDLGCFRCLSL